MLISGLLLEMQDGKIKEVLHAIKKINGLEVTEEFPENKLGLVLESKNTQQAVDACNKINSLPQITNLSLVYYRYV
ncbi:MAG: chaperone NapD [Spirochaetia bacterium]|nr:chaperone NapD [Spirochaetia bacterium]